MSPLDDAAPQALSRLRLWVEQLGTPSDTWGVAHARDIGEKLLPGAIARWKVARDARRDGLFEVHPFVEQLGVASGKRGLRDFGDLGAAFFGLTARWSVSGYNGTDYRSAANEAIEAWALQWPIDVKRKAFLLSALYAVAQRLPDTR